MPERPSDDDGAWRRLGAVPGLCGACSHAKLNQTRRGTAYLRCTRAEWDSALARYPRLPVTECPGFDSTDPRASRSEHELVVSDNPTVEGVDVTRPSVARVYDFWLGGQNNFAVDREMGSRMAEVNPALPMLVRQNREFVCAAAARAAEAGITQFLDLGSGLPAHPAVHEAVRAVNPDARVCYVDIDPMAVLHGEALLAGAEGLAAVHADLTEPETVLAHPNVPAVIDMAKPTAIILAAVLHFMSTEAAAAVCGEYMSRAARGSWLIVSFGHYEDKELAGRVQQTGTYARFWNHDAADLASMLAGLEPVAPGACEARGWIAGTGGEPQGKPAYVLAAAAVKPG
jgi:O-methyltransferase involved in polyketide biosynthesis